MYIFHSYLYSYSYFTLEFTHFPDNKTLAWSKIIAFAGNNLTLYHMITTFNDPEKEAF